MGRRDPVLMTLDGEDGRSSEELLMIAVLSRAIRDSLGDSYPFDMTKTGRAGRLKAVREAESWLFSPSISPYSFRWICDMLDIDHAAVLRHCDTLREAPEYLTVMTCNVKTFRSEIAGTRIRTRMEYLLKTLDEARKKK